MVPTYMIENVCVTWFIHYKERVYPIMIESCCISLLSYLYTRRLHSLVHKQLR